MNGEIIDTNTGVPFNPGDYPDIAARWHDDMVRNNWEAFHVGIPTDKHAYVYRYFDAGGNLMYVGMTSNAAGRAAAHWKKSDWWSWVDSVTYRRCRNRDAAYKLESKIRREEEPLFKWTKGYAHIISEMDQEYPNHVMATCDCNAGNREAA